jgi:hypothetical protein
MRIVAVDMHTKRGEEGYDGSFGPKKEMTRTVNNVDDY